MEETKSFEQERIFHLFSKLPAELRWKIWAFNLPGPRLVSVHCGSKSLSSGLDRDNDRRSPSSSFGCTSQAKIPPNLHACHESRREALRQYRPSFGIARKPGHTFFNSEHDYLYFGPRDGFMASEANLRTVLSLCDPAELAQVRRIAINEALFWVYNSAWHRQPACYQQQQQQQHSQNPPSIPNESHHHHQERRQPEHVNASVPHGDPLPPLEPHPAATAMTYASIAASLLFDILRLVHLRLPGLRELVFVPRDENPLYSSDCYLTRPAMAQNRLARQVQEAMKAAFGSDRATEKDIPRWDWKIMTLSADPEPPLYNRQVLGWREVGAASACRGQHGGAGLFGSKGSPGAMTRLGVVQDSARRFLEIDMEVDACGQ